MSLLESETKGITFSRKVQEVLADQNDRETLFSTLRQYQVNQDLSKLLEELKELLNEPARLELYEHIRPLILLKHQLEFSEEVPQPPGIKKRVIRLKRQPGESLGFAVRGGYEHGIGVFVSQMEPDSQAAKMGLKVGDEIVRVNGYTISEALHEDVLNLIKAQNEIVLKVTYIGMVPVKENVSDSVSWNYTEKMDLSKLLVMDNRMRQKHSKELKLFIDTTGTPSLGCGIVSGPSYYPGIFIEKVRPASLAAEAGLEVGDQIIEVNDQSFLGIKHKEAVVALKASKRLNIIIKKKMGLPLFNKRGADLQPSASITSSRPGSTSSEKTSANPQFVSSISMTHDRTPSHGVSVPPPFSSKQQPVRSRSEETEDKNKDDENAIISQHLDKFHSKKEEGNTAMDRTGQDQPLPSAGHPAGAGISTTSVQKLASSHDDPSPSVQFTEEDIYAKVDKSSRTQMFRKQPVVLGGKGAVLAARQAAGHAGTPTLLGAGDKSLSTTTDASALLSPGQDPADLFTEAEIGNRELVVVKLKGGQPLGIEIEGGIGTPLVDKILVAEIFPSGYAYASEKIQKGDQILLINNRRLIDVTSAQAKNFIKEAESTDEITLVLARGTFFNDEDAVTYF